MTSPIPGSSQAPPCRGLHRAALSPGAQPPLAGNRNGLGIPRPRRKGLALPAAGCLPDAETASSRAKSRQRRSVATPISGAGKPQRCTALPVGWQVASDIPPRRLASAGNYPAATIPAAGAFPLLGGAPQTAALPAGASGAHAAGVHHPDAAPKWCSEGEMPTATAHLLATKLRAASNSPMAGTFLLAALPAALVVAGLFATGAAAETDACAHYAAWPAEITAGWIDDLVCGDVTFSDKLGRPAAFDPNPRLTALVDRYGSGEAVRAMVQPQPPVVPLPASVWLMLTALTGLWAWGRRG